VWICAGLTTSIRKTTEVPSKRNLGKMLEVIVAFVVGLLLLAGVLVMLGPNLGGAIRRLRSLRPTKVPAVFQSRQPEVATPGLNPKTQRVVVASARLSNWLRAHGHDDLSRELRGSAARMTSNEPVALYALQSVLRKVRGLEVEESSEERLKVLSAELRTAVQDRFEQLELLPFKRP
jgi:transposase-like protein